MGEKLVIGPYNQGLRNDKTPFNIDNDSFPTLINAYQWRGRVKRKRGTSLLTRLQRYFNSLSTAYNSGSTTITLSGAGVGNILTGFSLQANGNIIPGSVTITVGLNVYTDPSMDGTLSPSGTIVYSTGVITILAEAGNAASAVFRYYPSLPVMGLEDLTLDPSAFPKTLAFDTKYSYEISTASPWNSHDVSFYKNPAVDTTNLPGYVPKSTWTPVTWNGQDYQQFWTVNYQGALWATNGINIPFNTTNIGMQFKYITGVTIVTPGDGTVTPAVADITINAHGLVQGDFIFVNEVEDITGINFQTGYVTSANPQAANVVRVTFPFSILMGAYTQNGIAQYLTSRSSTTTDCIRWYDGDPTNGSVTSPGFVEGKGWVNFMPPLSQLDYSISDLPLDQYYLVGARMIIPFKDRLLFLGPVVQTSASGAVPIYLQDTVIFSQNGTPYYTVSYPNKPLATSENPTDPSTVFHSVLLPVNQTATAPAFFEDQTGFGGFITAGVAQPINTAAANKDVLILGFNEIQVRLVYTGIDYIPFNFFEITSDLGSKSTFSAISFDKGVITRGDRGFVITSQVETQRIDLQIPDEVFQINLLENGNERVCSQRDFINEWIYFTFPSNTLSYKFPTQTLLYNYRDSTWSIFYETYTTYGQFKKQSGFTWATVGTIFPTWRDWNEPWNAGSSSLLQPIIIAGNQQGFVLVRDDGTGESNSLTIQSFSGNTVTCPNHCLSEGDYIIISGALGTISSEVNGKIFSVGPAPTTNTFVLNPTIVGSGTYFGGGLIKRMYVPLIQSKQFPVSWSAARKTRLGPQQYLLTKTANSQVQLLIFLSQDGANAYNGGPIVPTLGSTNNALIYSQVLYTCPESTNLGLTPANSNLQMLVNPSSGVSASSQIWHRVNTSLIGDTVQVGISMSDEQMRDTDFKSQFSEIELHGIILDVSPSMSLS